MINILLVLCLHLIGDFYLQSDTVARCKNASINNSCGGCHKCKPGSWINWKYFTIHAGLYFLPMFALFVVTDWKRACILIAILGVAHLVIDLITCFFKKRWKQIVVFIIDQALHVVSIVIVVNVLPFNAGLDLYEDILKLITGALILVVPCSIFVNKLLHDLYPDVKENGIFDIGSMIGVMERIMTVIFVHLGAFAAIAIIITVKTWARSDDLKGDDVEKKDFRNKYLLGTLSSLTLALLVYIGYKCI